MTSYRRVCQCVFKELKVFCVQHVCVNHAFLSPSRRRWRRRFCDNSSAPVCLLLPLPLMEWWWGTVQGGMELTVGFTHAVYLLFTCDRLWHFLLKLEVLNLKVREILFWKNLPWLVNYGMIIRMLMRTSNQVLRVRLWGVFFFSTIVVGDLVCVCVWLCEWEREAD